MNCLKLFGFGVNANKNVKSKLIKTVIFVTLQMVLRSLLSTSLDKGVLYVHLKELRY